MLDFLVNWAAGTPSFVVPYALAALGLIVTERSGVLSLGAEGYLLIGAMSGVGAVLVLGGYPILALAIGGLSAAVLSLVFAVLVVGLRVNQVIAGLAMVFLCQGLTSLVADISGWTSRPIAGLRPIHFGALGDIPVIGQILFRQDILVYALLPIIAGTTWVMYRTMAGLRMRSVGENPEAADAAGINVALQRFVAIFIGSALVGIAGAYLSVGVSRIWVDNMTGGRGWIAIALVIFARWHPWRGVLGALLFGAIESLLPRVAAAGIQVPQYFILMTPYLATLGVMIWTCAALRETYSGPAALGRAHVREERQ